MSDVITFAVADVEAEACGLELILGVMFQRATRDLGVAPSVVVCRRVYRHPSIKATVYQWSGSKHPDPLGADDVSMGQYFWWGVLNPVFV